MASQGLCIRSGDEIESPQRFAIISWIYLRSILRNISIREPFFLSLKHPSEVVVGLTEPATMLTDRAGWSRSPGPV